MPAGSPVVMYSGFNALDVLDMTEELAELSSGDGRERFERLEGFKACNLLCTQYRPVL